MTVDQDHAVARTERGGDIATEAPGSAWAGVGLLKPYAGGAVAERPRVDALATISAGYRDKETGRPVVSRDGTIHVAPPLGQAPGLEAALAERGNKALTIALVHNDPAQVLQQRFAAYSASRVEAHGNADEITVIHLRPTDKKDGRGRPVMEPEREVVRRAEDPTRYAQLAASMKVQSSLYFALAYWTVGSPPRPRLYFPDGLGLYRLRFTSLNSAESMKAALYHVASINGGLVAGVPLELSIVYQDVAGPDGSRRNVPIWSLRLRPPDTIQLEPDSVRAILASGVAQARMLSIAAPSPETLELAEYEGPDVDMDDARALDGQAREVTAHDVRVLADGGPIRNKEHARTEFFLAVGRTSLRDKDSRAAFISAFTHGRTDSLATFIETTTAREWARFLEAVADWVKQELEERQAAEVPAEAGVERPSPDRPARTYEQLFGDDDDPPARQPEGTRPGGPAVVTPRVDAAARLTGAPARPLPAPAAPPPEPAAGTRLVLPDDPDWLRSDERPLMVAAYQAWADVLKRLDAAYEVKEVTRLNPRALATELRGMVGYARETYAALYADDASDEDLDDGREIGESPDLAEAGDAPTAAPEPAPAF